MTELEPDHRPPTQVVHPWRAVLRTFIAALVALPVAWLARAGIDLTALAPAMVDSLTAVVYPIATGFVTWILARPKVNAFIEQYVPALAPGNGV